MKYLLPFTILLFIIFLIPSCSIFGLKPISINNNIQIEKKIYVDSRFSQEEVELIQKGGKIIENSTNGSIHIEYVLNFDMTKDDQNSDPYRYLNKVMMVKYSSRDSFVLKIEKEINKELTERDGIDHQASLLGYMLKRSKYDVIIIVEDRLQDKNLFLNTTIHETLHNFGAQHLPEDEPGIMANGYDYIQQEILGTKLKPITCLTKYDLEDLCENGRLFCDYKKMNHC